VVSAGAGVAVSSVVILASGFYTGGHVSCYMGGLSKPCHKFVTDVWKRLMYVNLVNLTR